MTRIAGLDIGNSTTELVVVDTSRHLSDVVARQSIRTVGAKGSDSSIRGAVRLIQRLRRQDAGIERVHVAPLRPVRTTVTTVRGRRPDTGPLRVLAAHAATPANAGFGVGAPLDVRRTPVGPAAAQYVLLVPTEVGFGEAAALIRGHRTAGLHIAAVLVARDEAVLLANRLGFTVPILDGVDMTGAQSWLQVAVEIAELGQPISVLADPHRCAPALQVAVLDAALRDICAALDGASSAAVALSDEQMGDRAVESRDWVRFAAEPGAPVDLGVALSMLADGSPRTPVGVGLAGVAHRVDDFFGLDVHATCAPFARPGEGLHPGTVATAMLEAQAPVDVAAALQERLGITVETVASETAAARIGALTTPGATHDTVVIDLGGGTMDVIAAPAHQVLAGCGQLVTAAVGTALGIPQALAEWVKRAPCMKIESVQVSVTEDGRRAFLDAPARTDTLGKLVVPGPGGAAAFTDRLEPQQWGALRRALKAACLGQASARAHTALAGARDVIVVGGPAADPEILGALRRCLPAGLTVGRGSVAGELGVRYAVAYGLATAAVSNTAPPRS